MMIYCLEDDSSIRELIVYTLHQSGMEAEGFAAPSAFWRAMAQAVPSLILLDIMLPEEDGLQILQKLRAQKSFARIPVMMLTAKGTEYDKVVGLDQGADDYMTKPFGMMELISRIRALLRRTTPETARHEFRMGELYVNASKHVVKVEEEMITLTLKEYELLCLLLENKGMVLSRDQILNRIWGYQFDGESRTVDVHVRTLRQKLGVCSRYIETVRGIGYCIREEDVTL